MWKTSWSYLPIPFGQTVGHLENCTEFVWIKNNVDGCALRLRFTNRYSEGSLVIEKVQVAAAEPFRRPNKWHTVRYHHSEQITLEPGEEGCSDPVEMEIRHGQELVVSMYFRQRQLVQSACTTYAANSWHAAFLPRDRTGENMVFASGKLSDLDPRLKDAELCVGICAAQVEPVRPFQTVALFGDSITHMSYFADALARQLFERYPGQVTVLNRGIGGNRLLSDGTQVETELGKGSCYGKAGAARYVADLYGQETPDAVVILEGVNDLMHPLQFDKLEEIVSANAMLDAVRGMAAFSKAQGSAVYAGTIMPYGGGAYRLDEVTEAKRREFNWLLLEDGGLYQAVDFASAVCETENPSVMRPDLHLGDGLHPNFAGGEVMAGVILPLLQKKLDSE